MKRLNVILPLIFALVATLLVACGGPTVAQAPPTYTPDKVSEIQRYMVPIDNARERMPELGQLIEKKDWIFVRNFIHGPLGQLRGSMSYVARTLLPNDEPKAKTLAEDLFGHLEEIDAASQRNSYPAAIQQYKEAVGDFDAFLSLIPGEPES